MTRVIYADILIATNIIVNYLLLRTTAVILSQRPKALRLFVASALGGVYSLIIFVDNMPGIAAFMLKIVFLSLLVPAAFTVKSLKAFLRSLAAFLLVNFAFAGIMLAVWITFMPNTLLYKNGAVYFDVNMLTLTLFALLCYAVLSLISYFTRSRVPQNRIFSIEFENAGKTVCGKALYDTGNTLCEGFSGKPVIVAEKSFILPLVPEGGREFFDGGLGDSPPPGFRMIPFATIKDGGAMPAFRVEKMRIYIGGEKHEVNGIYVAVARRDAVGANFSALIGTPLFDMINNEVRSFEAANKQNQENDSDNKITPDSNRGGLHKRAGHFAAASDKSRGSKVP